MLFILIGQRDNDEPLFPPTVPALRAERMFKRESGPKGCGRHFIERDPHVAGGTNHMRTSFAQRSLVVCWNTMCCAMAIHLLTIPLNGYVYKPSPSAKVFSVSFPLKVTLRLDLPRKKTSNFRVQEGANLPLRSDSVVTRRHELSKCHPDAKTKHFHGPLLNETSFPRR